MSAADGVGRCGRSRLCRPQAVAGTGRAGRTDAGGPGFPVAERTPRGGDDNGLRGRIGRTPTGLSLPAIHWAKNWAKTGVPNAYFFFPSASNWARYDQRSFTSFSFLMPAKAILVPGTLAFGSLMYSLKVASSQVRPDFLLASE